MSKKRKDESRPMTWQEEEDFDLYFRMQDAKYGKDDQQRIQPYTDIIQDAHDGKLKTSKDDELEK